MQQNDTPLSIEDKYKKIFSKYKYRIWSVEYNDHGRVLPRAPSDPIISGFDDLLKSAFDNFYARRYLVGTIICDASSDYQISSLIHEKLYNRLDDQKTPVNINCANFSEIEGALTKDAAIQKEFTEFNGMIVHDNTVKIYFGKDIGYCHIKPQKRTNAIDEINDLLRMVRDAIRFTVILPFLCVDNSHLSNEDDYLYTAHDLGKAILTAVDKQRLSNTIRRIVADAPIHWCFLISIPYDSFDTIIKALKHEDCFCVDMVVEVQNCKEELLKNLIDAIDARNTEADKKTGCTELRYMEDSDFMNKIIEEYFHNLITETRAYSSNKY